VAARAPADFDRLAPIYRALEFLAYGRDLERARFEFLDRLADRRSILVLGEGDGRCLARLSEAAPLAQIHCLDASREMLARAAARLGDDASRARVSFIHADALTVRLEPARYDAVVTLFFLDCFTPEEASGIVDRIRESLRPGALWLWADFVIPARGPVRLWALASIGFLYRFFRWQTGISARALPPAESLIGGAGFATEAVREFHAGCVRTAVFRRT
jgi:ubiquinone/menaquinone biosynthesis C-methylase UbiE